MKKMILMAVLVSSVAAVNAQATFGLKLGANFSNLKYSEDGDSESGDMKVGLNIGGLANIPLSADFSFQPELVFSMEGSKNEFGGIETKINLNYINIPVLLQYNVSGFIAETGPQLGFLIGAKFKAGDTEVDSEAYETINFSWAIGFGYKMPSGFGANVRYNLGLSNIYKDAADDYKVKGNTIQVGVFYILGGK